MVERGLRHPQLACAANKPARAERSGQSDARALPGLMRRRSPSISSPSKPWQQSMPPSPHIEASGHGNGVSVARDAFAWFFGDRRRRGLLADARDGSCFDGLMATGINRNQGAESILALHLAASSHAGELRADQTGWTGEPLGSRYEDPRRFLRTHDPIPTPSAEAQGGSFAGRCSPVSPRLAGQPPTDPAAPAWSKRAQAR